VVEAALGAEPSEHLGYPPGGGGQLGNPAALAGVPKGLPDALDG